MRGQPLKKGIGVEKKRVTYTYDALNRITSGIDNTGNYNLTSVAYDKNGNINHLERKGHTNTAATNFGVMDNLTYTYDSGNKLMKVVDASGKTQGFKDGTNGGDDYTYDENGNLETDSNKGITSILYNHLNLPTEIKFDNNNDKKINYTYDATGLKLKKVTNDGGSLTTTDYANGYIYENNTLQFFNHPEGYVHNDNGTFKYVYNYLDHLGNVRLSYADLDLNGAIDPNTEILDEKNYYPGGLQHQGYNTVVNGTYHPYGFNGKEENNEFDLNTLDFGARNYEPALMRWMNLDPMADKMPDYSPYNFVLDNPLSFVDPDGLYPRPILIYNQATDSYRFTNAAAHLLSLVSGVDKRQIQNAVISRRSALNGDYRPFYSANTGGGAITLGSPSYYEITYTENWFEDNASKYNGNGFGQDIYKWMSLSSHEVGHIPQIYREGSFLSYVGEFISQYATSGNHDGADYEKEADIGRNVFNDFNDFVNDSYGANSLGNLFENNSDRVITKRIDKWWSAFEDHRGKKEERTESFIKGLNTNLNNYSEGTYIYNGEEWVKKN